MRFVPFAVIVLSALFTLQACGPLPLQADVTAFRAGPDIAPGESVAVVPAPNMDSESIEVQRYLDKLADRLRQRGLTVVTTDDRPALIASLHVGIDDGRQEISTSQAPIWGQVGTRTEYRLSSTPASPSQKFTINSTPVAVPVMGIVGHSTTVHASTVYTRDLHMRLIRQNDDGRSMPVYEARLRSRGACSDLPALIDPLLDTLLDRFPEGGGSTRRSEVPLPKGHPCRN